MVKISEARKKECKERLLEILKPGDTVYCILRHVSRSGMTRIIDLYVLKDNSLRWIGLKAADLLELPYTDKYGWGVKVTGAGMDMGFWLVSNLSRELFNDDYALKSYWL